MAHSQDSTQLVHYTQRLTSVGSILRNGFLLIPNRRGLLHSLVDADVEWSTEPQECGMVSFTELPIDAAARHRSKFGMFGVAVRWSWALRHQIDRVIYVREEGPLFDAWRAMFTAAYRDVIQREDKGPLSWGGLSIRNRIMAGTVGARSWSLLLRAYEFMQPHSDSAQVEWRIVNKLPFHFSSSDKAAQIEEALEQCNIWQVANLRLAAKDVAFLCCPSGAEEELRRDLPSEFAGCSIIGLDA